MFNKRLSKICCFLLIILLIQCTDEELQRNPLSKDECNSLDTTLWLTKMVDFGIEDKIAPNKYTYTWSDAVFIKALITLYENPQSTDEKYINYIKVSVDKTLGKVNGGTPNDLAPGIGVVYLYLKTGDSIYLQKANQIYNDYKRIARASNGGVSHTYGEVQLWNDTLYMIGLFLIEMYIATNDELYITEYINQVKWHAEHLFDKDNGLWFHAWDEDKVDKSSVGSMPNWPDPETGRSEEFWGRGNGWIFMSLADALTVIPPTHPEKSYIEGIYLSMAKAVIKLQDESSGHWFQLPNYPNEKGNFLESSCTSMFGYGIARGLNLGILENELYLPVVNNAIKGLCNLSIEKVSEEYVWPVNICVGTSVGNKEYYYQRSIVSGVGFAFGSFILFGHEMQFIN